MSTSCKDVLAELIDEKMEEARAYFLSLAVDMPGAAFTYTEPLPNRPGSLHGGADWNEVNQKGPKRAFWTEFSVDSPRSAKHKISQGFRINLEDLMVGQLLIEVEHMITVLQSRLDPNSMDTGWNWIETEPVMIFNPAAVQRINLEGHIEQTARDIAAAMAIPPGSIRAEDLVYG